MANFKDSSRYAKYSAPFKTRDRRGRQVLAVLPADIPTRRNQGTHLKRDPQRLDHLAWHYLQQPDAYWSIVAHNNRILPDAVLHQPRIRIPLKED